MLWNAAPTLAYISRCPDNVISPHVRVFSHQYISWIPPFVNTIKVNTDGFFINGFTHGGLGDSFKAIKEIMFFTLENMSVLIRSFILKFLSSEMVS